MNYNIHYKIVIALEPDNHNAHFGRGRAYYHLGYTILAKSDWENALKLAKEANHVAAKTYEGALHELKEKRR
ncbi:MAG: hypothetical protein OXH00_03865 [Candidatus Poribacteria bacterium]|nr:hypothetical protein [Candidatus Poribacteria bacterium]